MNLFWKDRWALEPTVSVEILYTTLKKTFFMATRQKGRSNTDFFLSLKIFFSTNEPFFEKTDEP
jgi:hypothetical protein